MIRKFLRERRSWIIFFIAIQLLLIFISFIDPSIALMPMIYIVFLSLISWGAFVIIRYNKESKFYRSVQESDRTIDLSSIPKAETPFETLIEEHLKQLTEFYKEEINDQLTSLEQEKDELLSWIHEVKTPLTAMQLMIDRVDDENLRSQLRYEWLRVHLLVDQQLHQKRIPFIKNDLYIEKTAIEPLIFQEIKALKSWCIQKGIGFDVSLEFTEILTDVKWLGFIIRQLLTNAVKYSDSTDIIIKGYQQEGIDHLQIQDFGRGIDPKDLPRIFDKGFTSTLNHKDSASTGMGLYLTKKVAESLHIRLHVQSIVGKGTTFTLSFPKKNDFVTITSM
ncbi:sensor histidine kinase [Ornithinibacillus salinisoli]|uniref:histidine kinase n=1 Tax=Ornithinibacillus salinisoli TaxID=1848459 RepID=A0ABW4VYR4_9BACI